MRSPGAVVQALFAVLEGAALLVAPQAVSLFAAPQATQRFAVLEGRPRSVVARTAAALTTVGPGSSLVRRLASQSALQRLQPPTQRRIIPRQPIAAITPTLPAISRSTTVNTKTSRRITSPKL
jgi:hypothetical protein